MAASLSIFNSKIRKLQIFKNDHIVIKFLGKLLVLIALVGVLDYTIGSLVEYLYFHQGDNVYTTTTYIINEAEEDILIFGSSRANHHYISEDLTTRTGLSCYNAGCDGRSLFYDYALFKSALSRSKPEKVILDLRRTSMYYDQADYDRLSHLYPYYRDNESIREIVDLKGKIGLFVRMSKLYTYNSTILIILKSFVSPRTDNNGYIPFTGNQTMDPGEISYDSLEYGVYDESDPNMRLDENKIDILNSFIDNALQEEIDLYIIDSPYFYLQKDSNNISLVKIKEILKDKNLKYINFANDEEFTSDPGLFGDPTHLNHFGAKKFTELVSDIITTEISENP